MGIEIGEGPTDRSSFGTVMRFFGNPWTKKAVLFLLIITTGLILSPRYLVYADAPQKSDIIILFPVPEFEALNKEARELMKDGYSDYLCIPTSLSLYRAGRAGSGQTAVRLPNIKTTVQAGRPRLQDDISMTYFQQIRREYHFPRYYENTHVEMLLAKRVMDAYGYKKAIFVSSPAHMKRIKIMANMVFDSAYDIELVPSRYLKSFEIPLPSRMDMEHVFTELSKMVWFRCYDLLERMTGTNQSGVQNSAG